MKLQRAPFRPSSSTVVTPFDLLEHEVDPDAHGLRTLQSSLAGLVRSAAHSEVAQSAAGQPYLPVTYAPTDTAKVQTARVYCRAPSDGRSFIVQFALAKDWTSVYAIHADLWDYKSVDTHVHVLVPGSGADVTVRLTRPPGVTGFSAGDVVVVYMTIRGEMT